MITINITLKVNETKLSTNNYSVEQIVEEVKNEILNIFNYDEPDTTEIIMIEGSKDK